MATFNELFHIADTVAKETIAMRKTYQQLMMQRDKAALKAILAAETTNEALQVYERSGTSAVKVLAAYRAVTLVGTELSDIEDISSLPSQVPTTVPWIKNWMRDDFIQAEIIDRVKGHCLTEIRSSYYQERMHKINLFLERITDIDLLLQYWRVLPKDIRNMKRHELLKNITSLEELATVSSKCKQAHLWREYDFKYVVERRLKYEATFT